MFPKASQGTRPMAGLHLFGLHDIPSIKMIPDGQNDRRKRPIDVALHHPSGDLQPSACHVAKQYGRQIQFRASAAKELKPAIQIVLPRQRKPARVSTAQDSVLLGDQRPSGTRLCMHVIGLRTANDTLERPGLRRRIRPDSATWRNG